MTAPLYKNKRKFKLALSHQESPACVGLRRIWRSSNAIFIRHVFHTEERDKNSVQKWSSLYYVTQHTYEAFQANCAELAGVWCQTEGAWLPSQLCSGNAVGGEVAMTSYYK